MMKIWRNCDLTVLKVLHSRAVNIYGTQKTVQWLYDDQNFYRFVDDVYKQINGENLLMIHYTFISTTDR